MQKIMETSISELDKFCKKNKSFVAAQSGCFKGIAKNTMQKR
jgi:hypothetical protein